MAQTRQALKGSYYNVQLRDIHRHRVTPHVFLLACIKWLQLQLEGFDLIWAQVKLERVVHNLEVCAVVLEEVHLTG